MAKLKKKTIKDMIIKKDRVPATRGEVIAINRQISSLIITMEKRFDSLADLMDSRFAKISVENQRWLALYEEQNARNGVVMDSQGLIQHKFEEHDSRISSLEEKIHGIKND